MKQVRPKKKLGQHFLTDLSIARAIADTVDAYPDIPVLEIGPGMGVMTQFLVEKPRQLKVVEIDRESVAYLKSSPQFSILNSQFSIIEGDFLRMDLREAFDGRQFVLTGNYPYDISSQIFFKMLDNKDLIPCCTGMIQREVAERIASAPGNKSYGILSVLIQAWYDVEYLFTVDEHVFNPPPKVKSAVIRMTRNDVRQLGCDEQLFKKVVKTVFGQRRKMLRVSLRQMVPAESSIYTDYADFLTRRPEQLTVAQFVELTNMVERGERSEERGERSARCEGRGDGGWVGVGTLNDISLIVVGGSCAVVLGSLEELYLIDGRNFLCVGLPDVYLAGTGVLLTYLGDIGGLVYLVKEVACPRVGRHPVAGEHLGIFLLTRCGGIEISVQEVSTILIDDVVTLVLTNVYTSTIACLSMNGRLRILEIAGIDIAEGVLADVVAVATLILVVVAVVHVTIALQRQTRAVGHVLVEVMMGGDGAVEVVGVALTRETCLLMGVEMVVRDCHPLDIILTVGKSVVAVLTLVATLVEELTVVYPDMCSPAVGSSVALLICLNTNAVGVANLYGSTTAPRHDLILARVHNRNARHCEATVADDNIIYTLHDKGDA